MSEISGASLSAIHDPDKPILVAIDFSHDSKAALEWACNYSAFSGQGLILLHIVHDQAANPGFYKPAKDKELKPMMEVAESMMTEFVKEARNGDSVRRSCLDKAEQQFVRGLPPSRIVEVSELLNASLIVMGSRGITGPPHKLMGSVAERVVELSKTPVVVVKAEDIPEPKKKEIKRQQKQQKKDRRWLKDKLGLGQKPEKEANSDG